MLHLIKKEASDKIPEEKKGENKKEAIYEVIIIKNFVVLIRRKATSLNT